MQDVISGLKGIELMTDDILIYGIGDNDEEALKNHKINMENLLKRLQENNCKLNKDKLKLCQKSVKFFGHYLTNEGLKPNMAKIKAITDYESPTDKKPLLRFMGMVTYLGRYIPNLSTNTASLRKLTHEKVQWLWTKECENDFNQIKNTIANIQHLQYYDSKEPLVIECDASSYGLGAAIFQKKDQ